jgi:hypothetical protein
MDTPGTKVILPESAPSAMSLRIFDILPESLMVSSTIVIIASSERIALFIKVVNMVRAFREYSNPILIF